MFDDRQSRRVGAVVMVLVIAAGAAVVMVDCSKLRPSITVTATFHQVGQLAEGADVQIAGRVVGQVDAIQLVPKSGGVALRLRIQERYAGWAAPNGEYFITAKGVLGEPYLEIGPPPDGAARARGLQDGDTITGVDPPRMDQVLVRSFANMTAFRRLVDQVTPSARQLRTALDALATELDAIEPTPGAYRGFARSIGELGDAWEALATDWRQAGADPGEWVRLGRTAGDVMDRARGELQRVGAALDRL
ncbi:MAG TPA: MlaD family protein, partial [Kofleriaceae bacterium]|nr:MlaD family protein [Kofleriaceae bacterium]